jgi:hypothetical protein
MTNPILNHWETTQRLVNQLDTDEVYRWLIQDGYFPENYVLPPCFRVTKCPKIPKAYVLVTSGKYKPKRSEFVKVHFPKTELTDRVFGIIDPELHNDIAYHLSQNWQLICHALYRTENCVASYGFPIPLDVDRPGRIGYLRSGRMIYEYLGMVEKDLAAAAYNYSHIVRADIKSFYPQIYTHSIAWAFHGKSHIRIPKNLHNFSFVGNKLDKLFQNANDGCTNGIPIGPVVSDIIAEIIAAAVDTIFSEETKKKKIQCQAVRFKDDYRILVKSEADAKAAIKILQAALKEYYLELSDDKTKVSVLPDGLFREWVSMYHVANPRKKKRYRWKEFREIYLSVLRIDKACPGTGVIDRFLADIVTKDGNVKIDLKEYNLERAISLLLMLGTLRIKSFPKIMAILESIYRSPFGVAHKGLIGKYLNAYLKKLAEHEERNKYLISWIVYFLVSNDLKPYKLKLNDLITKTVINNKRYLFKECKDFKLFISSKIIRKKISMLKHLVVFEPPVSIN